MTSFVRAIELWLPDAAGRALEFGGGQYAEGVEEFREVSELAMFARDEGLPGKAWAARHPIILTDLSDSYFRRRDEAKLCGLTCGIALPVVAGDDVKAVLGLLCGDAEGGSVGAIELWHNNSDLSHEMKLVDGYYGAAAALAFNSRHVGFPRGYGLPGRAWKAGGPVIIKDIGAARQFLRAEDAAVSGIEVGLAIPYAGGPSETWVASFLSAPATPIARRFEIWKTDPGRDGLAFGGGACATSADLDAAFLNASIGPGEGAIGRAWSSGLPVLDSELKSDPSASARAARKAGLERAVVLPTFRGDRPEAIVVWYS